MKINIADKAKEYIAVNKVKAITIEAYSTKMC
jgi:hypothetical protein